MNPSATDDLRFIEEFITEARNYLFCEFQVKDFMEYDARIIWASAGEPFQEHQKKKRDLFDEYGKRRQALGKEINRVRGISTRLNVSPLKVIVQQDGGVVEVDSLNYLFADNAFNKNVALLNELHGECERATDTELYRRLNPESTFRRSWRKVKVALTPTTVMEFIKLIWTTFWKPHP